ncbi:MAG: alpha/beta hydrolase [Spirochaetes bacterium]|jgi:triacylglycerol lipase|nr:alpha/beta hydrolase [Spirochaetota bacterium]
MTRKAYFIAVLLILAAASAVFAGGTSSTPCKTKYPVVLSHGMGAQYEIAWGITHYWNNIPATLRDNGASVYITSVNALDGTVAKAESWKRQVLDILAISGAQKINLIGHSHGCIYSRYAISNLGMAGKVATHTSIAGPHRGSSVAELVLAVCNKVPVASGVLEVMTKILMGDTNPDAVQNLKDLTRSYMTGVFNPNTPDASGIYYQSYAYRIKSVLGSGLFFATWPIQKGIEGDNDGLVAVTSAKWGNFRGLYEGASWLGAGVNHLACVDMLFGITPGFDAPAHFVDIVKDIKSRGY